MEKTYILQVDLPDGSQIGDEYLRKESGIGVYYENRNSGSNLRDKLWSDYQVEDNPDFFELKPEEKPTISKVAERGTVMIFNFTDVWASSTIEKERLAEILIAESKGQICITDESVAWYKEYEMIDKMKAAFNESRLTNPMVGFKHDTFEDYIKSNKI